MKFGLAHRVLTGALAALGVLAIVLSGALPRLSTIILLVGLFAALFSTERFQQSSAARYASAIVPSVLLGVEFLRLVGGAPLLDLAVEFAAALQVVRLATRRGAMHDQQVVLLALLHLVAGTVLGGGVVYGLCLFGFLILAPGALVLSHLRREVEGNYRQGARDRTGLPVDVPRILRSRRVIGPGFLALTCILSLPIVLFTALLFIAFPRVGLSLILFQTQRAIRTTGFSESVDLGGVGAIRSDPAIVLRFRPPPWSDEPPAARLTLRLRGTAFDEYRGGGQWTRSTTERTPLPRAGAEVPILRYPDLHNDALLKIDLEPLDPPVIFLPERAVALRWTNGLDSIAIRPPPLVKGSESTLRYEAAADRVLRYEVFVAPPGEILEETLSDRDRARYLQIPGDMPVRVRELAAGWTKAATTDFDRARLIARRLGGGFRYTLDAPSGGKANPIDDFLFSSKAGHCEFFSSSMAIMLRAVGVPSRNVSGFLGGTYNRFGGFYAVRQQDAHSWVEAYVEQGGRHGWMSFDPTPPAGVQPIAESGMWSVMREAFEAVSQGWDKYIVGYDLPTQMTLFQRIQRSFERSRQQSNTDGGARSPSGALKRWLLVAGGGVIGAAAVAWWLMRRKRRVGRHDQAQALRLREQRVATQLWMQLEEALQARGAPRPRHVPPLRFAEQLRDQRADLGDEPWLLASRYAQARFGGIAFTADEHREFTRRVAELRRASRPGDAAQTPTLAGA